jgi:type IV secretory pathway TrbF-like protein
MTQTEIKNSRPVASNESDVHSNDESRHEHDAPDYSPYLAARREWDERYGTLIGRARNWRLATVLALALALTATCGLIALSLRAKVVPYVVAVDNLGRVLAAGPVDQASRADDRLKRAALFQWVSDLRTVTTDGIAQRKGIDRVYSMIASGSAAQVEIGDFYRSDPPYQQAQTKTVEVDVKAVFAASDKTYQVEWTEIVRTLSGQVESEEHWKGSFTIAVNPPTDERLIRVNPLGIYVTNVSWSKIL